MINQIIFFDNKKQSIEGTKRGLIAFVTLILCNLYYFKEPKLLESLIICSALGVQIPNNMYESVVYSTLIGIVIFSVCYETGSSFLFNVFKCLLSGCLIYLIYWSNKER
jgi:hypothetical protein